MFKIWNAADFRRSIAGTSLILAPIVFAAAEIIAPDVSGDAAAQMHAYGQHRTAMLAQILCSLAAAMLFIPALFGLLQQVRDRGTVVSHIAAIFFVYGLVATAALEGINLMFWEMAKPGNDPTAMANLLNGLQHEKVGPVILAGNYAFALAVLLLGIGLLRAKVAPRWATILVIIWPVVDAVISFNPIGAVASNVFGVVGLGAIGIKLLGTPDARWVESSSRPQSVVAEPVTV